MSSLPKLCNIMAPSSKTKVTVDAGTVEHIGFSDEDVTSCSEVFTSALSTERHGVLAIDFVGYVTEPTDPRDRGRVLIPLQVITSITVVSVNETAAVPVKQEL